MNIKILGANGFVGKYLSEKLKNAGHKIFLIHKDQNLNLKTEINWIQNRSRNENQYCTIINLVGKWRNISQHEIITSNYEYPKNIFIDELNIGDNFIWIQASSYFQLYKSIYGFDKDLYSKYKNSFSSFLRDETLKNSNLTTLDVFLPHLIGPRQPEERVFSQLALSKIKNKKIDLSSGTAIMPILDVRDFCDFMVEKIHSLERNTHREYETNYPDVCEILSLSSHVHSSLVEIWDLCNFSALSQRENEFTDTLALNEIYKINRNLRSLSTSFHDQIEYLKSKM
jgi:hypothetical protein